MTQEEKSLLIKDLCARLPYGVQVKINIPYVNVDFDKDYDYITNLQNNCILTLNNISDIQKITNDIKPYLRPMSSMTKEEYKELKKISDYYGLAPFEYIYDWGPNYEMIDWLNAHHFDYHGLIPMKLALEAPKGMY